MSLIGPVNPGVHSYDTPAGRRVYRSPEIPPASCYRVLAESSTLTPPSWTSKMKWGAGWSLQ
jgi:hypothetical protein